MQVTLFTTAGCHLCEEALEYWQDISPPSAELELSDVALDDDLLELYGEKIPVFRRKDNDRELAWPFSRQDLVRFLG